MTYTCIKANDHMECQDYMEYPRFLLELDISATAKDIYIILYDRSKVSKKNSAKFSMDNCIFVNYTISKLASRLGKSESAVKRGLKELKSLGLIETAPRASCRDASKIFVKHPAKGWGIRPKKNDTHAPDDDPDIDLDNGGAGIPVLGNDVELPF